MYSLVTGLYQWCMQKPEYKLLVLGLDGAGKTSFIERVKEIEEQKFMRQEKIPPTVGLNLARVEKRSAKFIFWDVGGQLVLRKIWEKYYGQCNAVIFVVDGVNENRLEEARTVLERLYNESLPTELTELPLLLLVNKEEHEHYLGIDSIREHLGLGSLHCTNTIEVMQCSAKMRTGIK